MLAALVTQPELTCRCLRRRFRARFKSALSASSVKVVRHRIENYFCGSLWKKAMCRAGLQGVLVGPELIREIREQTGRSPNCGCREIGVSSVRPRICGIMDCVQSRGIGGPGYLPAF